MEWWVAARANTHPTLATLAFIRSAKKFIKKSPHITDFFV